MRIAISFLIQVVFSSIVLSQQLPKQDVKQTQAPNPGKLDDKTSLKAIIIQLDKLSRAATKEFASAKSTADRQDAIDTHRNLIKDYLDTQSGKIIEVVVKVQDIAKDKGRFANTDIDQDSQLLVMTTIPKELLPFACLGKPLDCAKELSFHVPVSDKILFQPKKSVVLKGELVVSEEDSLVDGSLFVPIHLCSFSLTPALYTTMSQYSRRDNEKSSIWLTNVTFSDGSQVTSPEKQP
jgi:hypothetical protein